MSIIISENGKHAVKVDRSDIDKEDYLQNYIHENPESIPVYEIAEDKHLLVVAREFSTESGPIDALAIDKDGDIYVVETKLFKNPDKRTVVAQALDYGASLWRHSDFNEFVAKMNNEIAKKFSISLEEKIKEFFSVDDENVTAILESIKNNLQQGNIKFVVLMDEIEDRLKDLIVYVNQNSQFDIYAVQMEYYKYNEKFEIMIPKMFGVEVKKSAASTVPGHRRIWDEASFILQAKERLSGDAEKVLELYNTLKSKADKIKWGTGNVKGSFAPIINELSPTISPFSVYSDGMIFIKFSWLKNRVKEEVFDKYYNTFLNGIKENTKINLSDDELLSDAKIESQTFIDNYKGIIATFENTFVQN